MIKRLFVSVVLTLFAFAVAGAVGFTYTGAGADLNVATFDRSGNVVQGVTTLSVAGTDAYLVALGDSVRVAITGLQYPYAGDLQATLSLEDSHGSVLMGGDIFNQIGAFSPGDPGYGTQFGDSSSIASGNYVFDSRFSGDPWATAAALGSADSIPDE